MSRKVKIIPIHFAPGPCRSCGDVECRMPGAPKRGKLKVFMPPKAEAKINYNLVGLPPAACRARTHAGTVKALLKWENRARAIEMLTTMAKAGVPEAQAALKRLAVADILADGYREITRAEASKGLKRSLKELAVAARAGNRVALAAFGCKTVADFKR